MHVGTNLLPYLAGVVLFLVCAVEFSRKRLRALKQTTVVCPAAQMPASVRAHADGRIDSCSRLPGFEQCSLGCGPQLRFSADDLSEFAAKYEGKACASCGTALTRDDWYKSRLAGMLSPTTDPSRTNPRPICFACYAPDHA